MGTTTDPDDVPASPRTVVERYNLELWNERRFELADELLADEMVRHEPGGRTVVTRAQARRRVEDLWASVRHVEFRLLHVIAEGEYCTIVYQADIVLPDGSADVISSIEVFRVVDGRIVAVWNNAHEHAAWPEVGGDAVDAHPTAQEA
ncbi:MAG: nuclear transport factor 2 family protein [Solirubrobacteraceae bacterium]|nr:nuclear transport factor 2 family protein [Solirubrobacteraceae bacterium]